MAEDGRIRFVRALLARMGDTGATWTAEEVVLRLDETPIAIVLGDASALTYSAQVTALTAVNLLARLFQHLILVVPHGVAVDHRLPFIEGTLGPALVGFARRVRHSVMAEQSRAVPPGTVMLHIADVPASTTIASEMPPRRKVARSRKRTGIHLSTDRDIYCSGAGWLAQVGRQPAAPLVAAPEQANPIGPLIAAALGAAEVFKEVLGDAISSVRDRAGRDGAAAAARARLAPARPDATLRAAR